MANFIKESFGELEHVVWPTHLETKKFFTVVTSIIVAMTIFTYLLTLAFSNGLFELRNALHAPANVDLSGSPVTVNAVDAEGNQLTINGATTAETTTKVHVTEAPAQ